MRIVEIRECAIPLKSQPAQLELRLLRKQICPDSAGPFIVSILLALLFSLFFGAIRENKHVLLVPDPTPDTARAQHRGGYARWPAIGNTSA
jgi:hypothetical protein